MDEALGVVVVAGGGEREVVAVLIAGVVGSKKRTPALANANGRTVLFAEELNDWSRGAGNLNRISRRGKQ